MTKRLSVMIAVAGGSRSIRRTLESLAACSKPEVYRETVVVENGSRGDVERVVRSFEASLRARYVYHSEGNKSSALNEGLKHIGDDLLFFTDDDVRLDENVLCAYAEASVGCDGGRFYGGPLRVDYEERPPDWLIAFLPPSGRGWTPRLDSSDRLAAEHFIGPNWAAFSEDLRRAGGFDPMRGPGSWTGATGQESTMQEALARNGCVSHYVENAIVWHFVPRERCTEDWVLRRAFRSGVARGLERQGGRGGFLARVLEDRWQLGLKLWLMTWVGLFSRNPRVRFRTRYWQSIRAGVRKGITLHRRP